MTGLEPYENPLISPGAQFASLPPAVQNTIRAETGSAEIENIVKETSGNRVVYRVFFQNRKLLHPLHIAADGSLLNPDLTVAIGAPVDHANVIMGGPVMGITLNDLPPAIIKVLQHRAADAELDSIIKQTLGAQTTYLVTFKDRMHPPLTFTPEGALVAGSAP